MRMPNPPRIRVLTQEVQRTKPTLPPLGKTPMPIGDGLTYPAVMALNLRRNIKKIDQCGMK